jgi:choline dehydrogenase
MNSFWHRIGVGLKYLLTRKGMLAATSSMAHAVTRTRPDLERPDVKVQIYHISGKDRYSRSQAAGIDPYSGFSIGGFLIHPESRGSIHARSPDPLEAPLIEPNYLAHEADRRGAVDLLKLVRRIASQPALREVIVAERRPGPETTDDDGLLAYARETGQTSWHQIATCRMGNDPQSVVDARLRVRGVTGLRLADASIMPTMASTNTNAPAIMIGERAADLVLEDAAAAQPLT